MRSAARYKKGQNDKLAPPRGILNPINPVSTTTASKGPVVPDSYTYVIILGNLKHRLANKPSCF